MHWETGWHNGSVGWDWLLMGMTMSAVWGGVALLIASLIRHRRTSQRLRMTTGDPLLARTDGWSRGKRVIGLTAVGFALSVSGCSSDESAAPSSDQNRPTFTLSEFKIKLSQPTLASGRVMLTATNVGGEEHELVIVRVSSVGDLPKKVDGSVDEEKIPEADKMGEIEHVGPNQAKSAEFELASGTYVAFCNLIDTMDSGGSSDSMMGGTDTSDGGSSDSMMGGANDSSMTIGGGHVHFAQGMYEVITVA